MGPTSSSTLRVYPVSSASSRTAASGNDSDPSTPPPGVNQNERSGACGSCPRTSSNRPSPSKSSTRAPRRSILARDGSMLSAGAAPPPASGVLPATLCEAVRLGDLFDVDADHGLAEAAGNVGDD